MMPENKPMEPYNPSHSTERTPLCLSHCLYVCLSVCLSDSLVLSLPPLPLTVSRYEGGGEIAVTTACDLTKLPNQ